MLESKPVAYNLDNLRYVSERMGHLPYFIFYGTLLGFVREKSIIVGDDDIDFLVESVHKPELVRTFQSSELKLRRAQPRFRTPHFSQGVRLHGSERTFVDFYLFDQMPDQDFIIDRWNFKGRWQNRRSDLHIPRSILFPIQDATMQGIPIKIPADPEACCEFLYGKDWRTPMSKKTQYKVVIKNHRPEIVPVGDA